MIFSPNTPHTFKKFLSSTFGVSFKLTLGKYFGVHVDSTALKNNYSELLDKLQQKLCGWKEKLLSQARRLVLIKSVLSSIPLYKMSSYALPKKRLLQMDSLVTNFFQGYKKDRPTIHLLKKDFLYIPKHIGGLGIKSFPLMNKALLAKQFWRFFQNQDSLFAKWTISKYFKGRFDQMPRLLLNLLVHGKEFLNL